MSFRPHRRDTHRNSRLGRGQLTEPWQTFLHQEIYSSDEHHELSQGARSFTTVIIESERDRRLFSSEIFGTFPENPTADREQGSNESIKSIEPCAITISSGLKDDASQISDIIEPNASLMMNKPLHILNCCISEQLKSRIRRAQAQKSIRQSDSRMRKYYHLLKTEFSLFDSLLLFHESVDNRIKISQGVNIASAQLWFVTFAIAKEMNFTTELRKEDLGQIRRNYQYFLTQATQLSLDLDITEFTLNEVFDQGLKSIRNMKESLTGSPLADLAAIDTSPVDDFLIERDSWYESIQRIKENQPVEDVPLTRDLTISNLAMELDMPDTLSGRIRMEIYIRNITKISWMRFSKNMDIEVRLKLLRLLLTETLYKVKHIVKIYGKIQNILKDATLNRNCCKSNRGLLQSFFKTERNIAFCVNQPTYEPKDFEFLRYFVICAENRLETIMHGGIHLQNILRDVIETCVVCSDLVERRYDIGIEGYEGLRTKLRSEQRYGPAPATSDLAISTFYFNQYGNLLMDFPISFRLSQFRLAKNLSQRERHSAVDFGTRYFGISQ